MVMFILYYLYSNIMYLSKKLCDRLGLKLDIASTEKEYTRLTITFPKGTVHNFSE